MKLQLLNVVRETSDEKKIKQLTALGYKEIPVEALAEEPKDKPLDKDKMNKDQLLAIATAEGVTVPDGATKADIVKLIEEARAK
ncbi:MAG TPA: hypothetical protein PKB13_09880 [Clostridia bacterium]|nr:hypothetical protein [Clostridia bacterium]